MDKPDSEIIAGYTNTMLIEELQNLLVDDELTDFKHKVLREVLTRLKNVYSASSSS